MNIYSNPDESDSDYNKYYSLFKVEARAIVPEATEIRFNDWMKHLVIKFPFYLHTNPKVMAIASLMADNPNGFDVQQANLHINTLFARTKGDTKNVIIDVKRYYNRLKEE